MAGRYATEYVKSQQQHKSEIALDNYNNWDYIIKNNGTIEDLKLKIIDILEKKDNVIKISVSDLEGC